MENPYASPQDTTSGSAESFGASRLVRHVGILAVLMMVQGALEICMGVMVTAAGPLMFALRQAPPPGAGGNLPGGAGAPWALVAIYGGLGLATLVAGGLRILTGILNLQFRGRVLGIVSLSFGMVSLLSCYCGPTSVALFIYGLIVLLNGDVTKAFEMAKQGVAPKEIKATYFS